EFEELFRTDYDLDMALAARTGHFGLYRRQPARDIGAEQVFVGRRDIMILRPYLGKIGNEEIVQLRSLYDDAGTQIHQRRHQKFPQFVITLTSLLPCQWMNQFLYSVFASVGRDGLISDECRPLLLIIKGDRWREVAIPG